VLWRWLGANLGGLLLGGALTAGGTWLLGTVGLAGGWLALFFGAGLGACIGLAFTAYLLGRFQAASLRPLLAASGWTPTQDATWVRATCAGWIGCALLAGALYVLPGSVLIAWTQAGGGSTPLAIAAQVLFMGLGGATLGALLGAAQGPVLRGLGLPARRWILANSGALAAAALAGLATSWAFDRPLDFGARLLGGAVGAGVFILTTAVALAAGVLAAPASIGWGRVGMLLGLGAELAGCGALALGAGAHLRWDQAHPPLDDVYAVCWQPDSQGLLLAATHFWTLPETAILTWDLTQPGTTPVPLVVLPRNRGMPLEFSPDGQWVAYATEGERQLRLQALRAPLPPPLPVAGIAGVQQLAYRPDSRQLAVASSTQLWLVGVPLPAAAEPPPAARDVTGLAYLADGRLVSRDATRITVAAPDAAPAPSAEWPIPGAARSSFGGELAVAPHASRIAVTLELNGETVVLWNLAVPGSPPTSLPIRGDIDSVAFSPDDQWLALGTRQGDGTVLLYSLSNLAAPPVSLPVHDTAWPLVFSPDGRWLAVGTRSDGLWIWDTRAWTATPRHIVPAGPR
jgi:hypothetical protein